MNTAPVRTARITGALYLALVVAGTFSFLFARGAIYVEGDAAATAANLIDQETLARLGLAGELASVAAAALLALWFFRLFRPVNPFAAGSLAAFGLFNAATILVGAAFTSVAIGVGSGELAAPDDDPAGTAMLMYDLNGAAWGVGTLFFGLWLIPMGRLVVSSGYMPRLLGHLLVLGGFAYIASAFISYLWPSAPGAVIEGLALVPQVGEFWIMGYLLIIGVRRTETAHDTL
ncbi:DUF4386 domain-containing protein [Glycomyces salinus]|uniref:DUF4386 domain-containing protein n=1 Tax=Glycomyces salinus TaxID=980294 RepID=UPI0018ED7E49|nr:DUF4386 domain-containing protein [Glycomyces salinus]